MTTAAVSTVSASVQGAHAGDFTVSVVTGRAHLEVLRDDWTDLLLHSHQVNAFLTWEWMTAWLDEYAPTGAPYVVLVRRTHDGALAGLAPFYRPAAAFPIGLQTMRFMGSGVGADHLGVVCRRGLEEQVRTILAEHLLSAHNWELLDLQRMDEETARWFHEAVTRQGPGRFASSIAVADVCPFLALPGTWEEYLQSLGSRERRDFGRQWRRLQEQGAVVIERVESADGLERAWEILRHLHLARREAVDGRSGFTTRDQTEAFHQRFMRAALERGWLRCYLMRVGDRHVAAEYCINFGGRIAGFQGGFDTAWARYSVRALLMAHAIQEAIAEGAWEFDFLRGGEAYKQQRWQAVPRHDLSLLIWRRSPVAALKVAARRWVEQAKTSLARRRTKGAHAEGADGETPPVVPSG